ncbi:UNVERIFIED_CONTAM: hypothetical protein Sindi_2134100 [Sesamum indicum]
MCSFYIILCSFHLKKAQKLIPFLSLKELYQTSNQNVTPERGNRWTLKRVKQILTASNMAQQSSCTNSRLPFFIVEILSSRFLFPLYFFSEIIVVREARIEDCWEVTETHCSCFFPEYSFPLDFVLRMDRLVGMLFGFSIPKGCRRTCLVAVTGSSGEDSFFVGSDNFKIGGLDGKFSLNKGYVAGILTVDTVADFLPRKGPLRQRRTGIAYVSNVAVRERFRRKGIAKRLIAKAEAKAKTWGCRSIALHCDLNNPGATKLYMSQGFKCIKVPEGANWPQPRTSADVQFNFMMKLL